MKKKRLYFKIKMAIVITVTFEVIYSIIKFTIFMITNYKIYGMLDKIIAGLIIGCTVLFVDYLGDKKHIDEI